MDLQTRIDAFVQLGILLKDFSKSNVPIKKPLLGFEKYYEMMPRIIEDAKLYNGWFTEDNIRFSFSNWANELTKENIENWMRHYKLPVKKSKRIALIMAGNVPLVGFHDFLCVLLSGHKALIKLSSNDKKILPFLTEFLIENDSSLKNDVVFTDGQLDEYNAVIATGSDNTSRYFEYYFRNKPHIIRKNRNAVALLTGNETKKELELLADDIFRYYGLGCRNVAKLYVPENYNFQYFFEALYNWKHIVEDIKYMNNYDYNKAIYLMSNHKTSDLLDNNFLLLKEEESLSSPIGVLFYSYYKTQAELEELLLIKQNKIQCIVSKMELPLETIDFGKTQTPRLTDYADYVDTMKFLEKL